MRGFDCPYLRVGVWLLCAGVCFNRDGCLEFVDSWGCFGVVWGLWFAGVFMGNFGIII